MSDELEAIRGDIERWVVSGLELYEALNSMDDGSLEVDDLKDVIVNGLGGRIYRGDDAS